MSTDVILDRLTVKEPPDSELEEVTETKIVGVTEAGVIRKRSFKRKVTKEEKTKLCGFGHDKAEYEKIAERVQAERLVSGTVEGLQERWKMINFMHSDCMDMVAQWQSAQTAKLQAKKHELTCFIVSAICVLFLLFVLLWIISRCIW